MKITFISWLWGMVSEKVLSPHIFLSAKVKTPLKPWEGKEIGLGVLICLDMVSIETLDLDSSKTDILTVEKVSMPYKAKS
jgi:hypothetical protein